MKLAEFFAGIAGFGFGFQRAGFEVIAQIEIDKQCTELLERHFPTVTRYEDVQKIDESCRAVLGGADVYAAGFPCQDVSLAGNREGLDGERSGLWFEFLRIVALFLPPWIVIENVPGLLSVEGGRDFARILCGLEKLGYCVAWKSFNARYFGLAQNRERVFVVASLGAISCAEVLFDPSRLCWDSVQGEETQQEIAPCVRGGTESGSNEIGNKIACPITTRPYGDNPARESVLVMAHGQTKAEVRENLSPSLNCNHETPIIAKCLNAGRDSYNDGSDQTYVVPALDCRAGRSGENGFNTSGGLVVPKAFNLQSFNSNAMKSAGEADAAIETDVARSLDSGGSVSQQGGTVVAYRITGNDGAYEQGDRTAALNTGTDRTQHVLAFTERTRPDGRNVECQEEIAYALTSPGEGGRTHDRRVCDRSGVRRLTPLECERLQGFPDGWTSGLSDSARYRMLGNAVPPPITEYIADRIHEVHSKGYWSYSDILATYAGSDGSRTRKLYEALEKHGALGIVAMNLFRACKASERAKVYRGGMRGKGSFRAMAYEKKQYSMDQLCEVLTRHAQDLGIVWGWKDDPMQEHYPHVLYIELSTGQVSFHSNARGKGPEFPSDWDQSKGTAAQRICKFIEQFL